jgi:glutamate racemase
MSRPIGILDSGLGGLTVAQKIKKLLPKETIIYFADSMNAPYSKKSKDEIYKLAKKIIEFLLDKDVKIIVLACNTITVVALERLRKDFPNVPIVGTVPVIKTAAKLSKSGRIGVFSTLKTSRSQYQKSLIERFAQGLEVVSLGSDLIVPLIEQGKYQELDSVLLKALEPFKRAKIDVLALGCTHFPLVKEEIKGLMGKQVKVIDSGAAVARQVKRILGQLSLLSNTSKIDEFYTTGDTTQMRKIKVRLELEGEVKKLLT